MINYNEILHLIKKVVTHSLFRCLLPQLLL
jgi:hypothetical protein